MNIYSRVKKLEIITKKNSKGWFSFRLNAGVTLEEGCKRVGIPTNASNCIGLKGGFPLGSYDPPYLYWD